MIFYFLFYFFAFGERDVFIQEKKPGICNILYGQSHVEQSSCLVIFQQSAGIECGTAGWAEL